MASYLYLVTSILTCAIPKAVPVLRIIRDMEALSVVDPCCCCQGRTRGDVLEEQTDLIKNIKDAITDDESDNGIGGMFVKVGSKDFPQNYDSSAGVTLQDQYNASYDRWVRAENIYNQNLDRFKEECADVELEWRDTRARDPNDIEDDEIRRLVLLLADLKSRCTEARESMENFQRTLGAIMDPSTDALDGGNTKTTHSEENEPENSGKKADSLSASIISGMFRPSSN